MSMPAEIQVHHEEILDLKESKVHLLYEIARAKSIGILRGGASALAKAKPATRMVPYQPAASGDQTQLAAQLEEMKRQLDAKDAAVKERDGEIAKLRLVTEGSVPIERKVQKVPQPPSVEATRSALGATTGAIKKEMEQLKERHAKELEHESRQLAGKEPGVAPYTSQKGLPSKIHGADLVGKRLFVEGYGEGTVTEYRKTSMGASSHCVGFRDASAADGTRTEVLILHHFRLGAATGVRYVVLS